MAFGQQAAGRVGDDLAAVGVVACIDKCGRFARCTQADGFVGDQFVLRKTVV